MKNNYTIAYEAAQMNGEPGFWFRLYVRNALIAEGWSRGRRHHAEKQAREAIHAREVLLQLAAEKVA